MAVPSVARASSVCCNVPLGPWASTVSSLLGTPFALAQHPAQLQAWCPTTSSKFWAGGQAHATKLTSTPRATPWKQPKSKWPHPTSSASLSTGIPWPPPGPIALLPVQRLPWASMPSPQLHRLPMSHATSHAALRPALASLCAARSGMPAPPPPLASALWRTPHLTTAGYHIPGIYRPSRYHRVSCTQPDPSTPEPCHPIARITSILYGSVGYPRRPRHTSLPDGRTSLSQGHVQW